MRNRMMVMIFMIISLMIFTNISVEGSYDGQRILDPEGDVIVHSFKERKVSGYEEIDIVSLETFDRVGRVEAYLTMDDDIVDTFGYFYSISVAGVTITYDNGTFQVFRDRDQEVLDNVQVEVTDTQIFAEVPKSEMETEFRINATAQKFILDYGSELTYENYYDSVEGEGISPISKFQVLLEDEDNDVRFSFVETGPGEAPYLDIIGMDIIWSGDQITVSMDLLEDIPDGYDVEFTFFIGLDGYRISGDEVTSLQNDGRSIVDHTIDTKKVSLSLSGAGSGPGETISGTTKISLLGGGWMDDRCPEGPFSQIDILPIGSGSSLSLSLKIDEDGSGSLSVSTSDLDPYVEDDLKESMDLDSSGSVEVEEIDSLFSDIISGLKTNSMITLDGANAVDTIFPLHSGIMDDGPFEIGIIASFTVDLPDDGTMKLEIVPFRSSYPPETNSEIDLSCSMILPEGFRILPYSIEPGGLGNHLTAGSRSISISSTDPGDIDLFTTGFSFEFKKETESEPVDGSVTYEDVPTWVYIVGFLVLVGIAALIIKLGKGKEPPTQDY